MVRLLALPVTLLVALLARAAASAGSYHSPATGDTVEVWTGAFASCLALETASHACSLACLFCMEHWSAAAPWVGPT